MKVSGDRGQVFPAFHELRMCHGATRELMTRRFSFGSKIYLNISDRENQTSNKLNLVVSLSLTDRCFVIPTATE
jgi:hypothetical protein